MNSGPTAYRFLAAPQSEYHTFLRRTSPRPFAFLLGRRGGWLRPATGCFFSSWKRGERLRPTFLFLLREKKKRAAPGTKKKSAGSGFRGESCSFFLCALRPENGCFGAMRTGFTACAAAADGCAFPFIVHLNKMNKHSFPLCQDTLQKGKCRTVMFLLQ